MADQSHLEAMREAIKGDIERARARRPSIFERPAPPPVEIREAAPPPEPKPEPEPAPIAVEQEPAAVEPDPEPEPEPAADVPRPSLLSRLAFWRR